MAINQSDVDLAMYLLNQSIYTGNALPANDCVLVKKFIEAALEHQHQPAENTKSREWRAGIYRKLLDDPQALEQFTQQALVKFGPNNLARMVAPQLQELIVDQHIRGMPSFDLIALLKTHNRLTDILDYAMEQDEEWVLDYFGLRGKIESAYNAGRRDAQQESAQADDDDDDDDDNDGETYEESYLV